MTDLSTFKTIPGYNDYLVNENGDIFSKKINKLLSPRDNGQGYLNVALYKNGEMKNFLIHRLVAMAFLDNPNNYPVINHIDGNKSNNHINNLEWCTYSQNTKHAYDLGLNETCRAAARKNGKINNKYAQEARKKHLDENLKELFDDIFKNQLKQKDICQKFNLKKSYVSLIKSKRFLQTALNEYFGDTHE